MFICPFAVHIRRFTHIEPFSCWTRIYTDFANSIDPDELASEEANWSGSALFVTKDSNLYQQPESNNPIGWKLEVGMVIYSAWQGLREQWWL